MMFPTGFSFLAILAVALFHLTWMLVGVVLLHKAIRMYISRPDRRYFVSMLSLAGLIVAIPASFWLAVETQQHEAILISQETFFDNDSGDMSVPDSVPLPIASVAIDDGSVDSTPQIPISNEPNEPAGNLATSSAFHADVQAKPESSQLQRMVANAALPVSICYLLGVAVMLIRLCTMLAGLHWLTKNATPIENKNFVGIIKELDNDCGLRVPPKLLASGRIVVPLASGIWQNSILIPTSMLTGLSMHEIRCILAHELAHLRRRDSLILLLQRVVETLLFFHPATWWISRDLSNDREYCCDQLVVNAGICPIEYSQTLCKVAELTRQQLSIENKLSVAISGNNSAELVNRIRILVQPNLRSAPVSVGVRTILPIFAASVAVLIGSMWVGSESYTIQEPSGESVTPESPAQENEDEFFTVRLLTPNGQPAKDATMKLVCWKRSGQVVWPNPEHSDGGEFQFSRKYANRFDRIILTASDATSGAALSKSFLNADFAQLFDDKTGFRLEACTSITGTVRDFESGKPISGAEVKFLGKQEGIAQLQEFDAVTSDQSGRFLIPLVLPGTTGYLTAKHERYLGGGGDGRFLPDKIEVQPDEEHDIALPACEASHEAKIQPVKVPDVSVLSPQDAIETLLSKYKEDLATSRQLAKEATTLAEKQLIWHRTLPHQPYQDAMLALADANRGTQIEAHALACACNVGQHTEERVDQERIETRKKIADRLLTDHIESPHLGICLDRLVYSQSDAIETAARILEKNPAQTVQGNCLLLMALTELRKRETELKYRTINRKSASDDELATYKENAIEHLTRIVNNYSHIPYWQDDTLGNYARNQLAKLQRFTVGSMAPEISGLDQDGKPMTLSQFRGRYVVLDFWGSWCAPCIGDLPELNELSKAQAGKVVVLGVVNDTKQDALNAIKKHGVTWPNWTDSQKGKASITDQWQIDSWPTTIVIDPEGVIRSMGMACLLYTSPSPRDRTRSRMPSSA